MVPTTKKALSLAVLSAVSFSADGFFVQPSAVQRDISVNMNKEKQLSRAGFISVTASAILATSQIAVGVEDETAEATGLPSAPSTSSEIAPSVQTITRSIDGCPKPIPGKPNNCIATSNIKQLDTYSPPWTFDDSMSGDEAFARLKGIVKKSSEVGGQSYNIIEIDEKGRYMKIETPRGIGFNFIDSVEFVVRADDQVVIFKSSEKPGEDGSTSGLSDFGANRKRIEELRKSSGGAFQVMGSGLGTADSYDGGAQGKRNGWGGQLKAFYGLNSGAGYQDVFN